MEETIEKCRFCGEDSDYDFCSDECSRAYWSEFK